jgi:hypothetical protein
MRSMFRSAPFVVALAIAASGVVAGSASAALPEFKGLPAHESVTFTGTSERVSIEESGGSYLCTSSGISGEIINATEVANVVLKFSSGGASSCTSFCKNITGGWESKPLKGRIGFLSSSPRRVGLLLEAVSEPFATCTTRLFGGSGTIGGSVIAEIGPLDVHRRAFTLTYATTHSTFVQSWRHFEGEELLHNLTVLPHGITTPVKFAIEDTLSLATSHEIEIAA